MDFSNLSDRDLYNLWLNKATLNPADRTAVIQEYNTRNASGNFNSNRSIVQPTSTPVQVNVPDPTVGDVPPASARYTRPDTVAPAQVQQDAVAQQMSQAQAEQDAQNVPLDEVDYIGIQPFDDWVKTVPPEQLATYGVPIPEQVPAKEPVNNRVFTVPAQKPAGMPSRVWEQMNPSKNTETTVTTIPTASQQNPYLGPTVQDPSSYSLNNMNKLQPGDHGIVHNGQKYKLTSDELNQWMEDNPLPPPEISSEPEQSKEDKTKKSEERKQKIKDKIAELSESNDIGETGEQIASTASAMLADAANVGGSVDPSGTSATLRAQADTAAKQAALMDARRQAADRIWNRDLKAEADKKAAAGAAAENAQRIASTAAGESTVGQRGVKAADYNYEEGRADTARKEGTELSKDANQYQNAAYQRAMDAQKADYDYNENRKINNRIYQLTGGIGVKKDDGSYQVVGGNRDKDNNPVSPEQQPTGNNTQPTNNNATPDNSSNNTTPAPATSDNTKQPDAVPDKAQSSNVNNVNFTDEAIKQREAARQNATNQATSTPQFTTQSTDTASKQAAGVAPQSTEVPAYVSCLHRWYNFVTKNTNERGTSDIGKLPMKSQADLQTVISYCDRNRKPGDPQFNLNDLSRENLLKVYNYVEPYVYKKGGK